MTALGAQTVRESFLAACRAELAALKPGNVHIHSPGHGMDVRQFEASAQAAAPFISDPSLKVGTRIRRAVEASFEAAGCNTNLGILLLCAPLAAAAEAPSPRSRGEGGGEGRKRATRLEPAPHPNPLPVKERGEGTPSRKRLGDSPSPCGAGLGVGETPNGDCMEADLRPRLARVLDDLDVEDAAEAFAAIAYAKPAGLGRVDHEDIWLPPTLTLKQAMALAAHRDRIARAYVTDFDDVFDFALPRLKRARAEAASPELAVTTLHMAALAAFDDSHIMRKHGAAVAADVRRAAESRRRLWEPVATPGAIEALLAFDAGLKARGVNPGTTADFVVAALFADQLASATRA